MRNSAFPFTGPRVTLRLIPRCSQSSGWGSSGRLPPLSASNHRSSLFAGPDRTPKSNGTWNGSRKCGQPWRPNICTRSPARLPAGILLNLLSRILSSQFLRGPPAVSYSDETLSRALARTPPCLCHFAHPWSKAAQDATAPPSLSLLGAVEAHAFELPDVLALTSGPVASTQAAIPLSRTALALHSSWGRTRTVSFSLS